MVILVLMPIHSNSDGERNAPLLKEDKGKEKGRALLST